MYAFFEFFHPAVWQRPKTEDTEGVVSLIDLGDSNIVDDTGYRCLHYIFEGICDGSEHVWVDEAPEDGQEGIHPFHGFREEICSSLGMSKLPTARRRTYCFAS